jgi:hypothetical protein
MPLLTPGDQLVIPSCASQIKERFLCKKALQFAFDMMQEAY